jgi:hypothetical protein
VWWSEKYALRLSAVAAEVLIQAGKIKKDSLETWRKWDMADSFSDFADGQVVIRALRICHRHARYRSSLGWRRGRAVSCDGIVSPKFPVPSHAESYDFAESQWGGFLPHLLNEAR